MSQQLTRQALEVALNTWAAANSVAVAWQNVDYVPTVGTKYARAYLLPADPQNPSLGDAHKRLIGIFQVSLYLPENKGSSEGEALADSLVTTFARGASFTASTVTVRVLESPGIRPATSENGYYVIPVDIRYQSDIY